MIFYVGNDGVPFDFSSVVGDFFDFVDCAASYLAVFTVYIAAVVVFVLFFVLLIGLNIIGVFSWIQDNILSSFL